MAGVPRVLESVDGGEVNPVDIWRTRLEATLSKAERLASLYHQEATKGQNKQWARNYYKHARREAREASKIIGVLEIEFGAGMAREVERARKVFFSIASASAIQE